MFFEKVAKYANEGYPVNITYLDFTKAFENVSHQRLLFKLMSHDFGNVIVK